MGSAPDVSYDESGKAFVKSDFGHVRHPDLDRPSTPPPPPDITDEIVGKARLAMRNKLLTSSSGLDSSFLTGPITSAPGGK